MKEKKFKMKNIKEKKWRKNGIITDKKDVGKGFG